jgi:hypothetical protein
MMRLITLALVALMVLPAAIYAAGPADSPAAYTFTADGGMRIATGTTGPASVAIRCGAGTAGIKFVWIGEEGQQTRVAPRPRNGTATHYPLVGDGVELLVFEFSVDGPDSIDVDLGTATKVDAVW